MILTTGMAHPRKLIRQTVVALLAGANTAAGTRVLGTRIVPHRKSGLPALSVYTLSDPVDQEVSTDIEETHELELEIAGWVAHTEALPVDDAMDDLAEQVQTAMRGDPFLSGKASEVRFKGTVMEVVEDDGRSDPTIGVVVLTYLVTYREDLTAAAPTDDFITVNATHKIAGGVADTAPASDQFTVQETPP